MYVYIYIYTYRQELLARILGHEEAQGAGGEAYIIYSII